MVVLGVVEVVDGRGLLRVILRVGNVRGLVVLSSILAQVPILELVLCGVGRTELLVDSVAGLVGLL